MKYILSIDQGTTGTTAAIIDATTFKFISKVNKEFKQIFPSPGLVEHDLNTIWKTVETTIQQLLMGTDIDAKQIISIGITNQRETTCAFNKTGKPLHNAIVWQDRRTFDICNELKNKGYENLIKTKTGLPIDPYFSGTKIKWLLDNSVNVKTSLSNNDLYFGTIDTFLLYKLTNNKSFFTEASNASRTMLMNLETGDWDDELLNKFNIQKKYLPEIKNTFDDFGFTENLDFLPDGIPINCLIGDQQSALFGQAGYDKQSMKCTYGTGAFMLLNTGKEKFSSKSGLLTTIAFKHNNTLHYALEGSTYVAGAAVQWLRDNLNIITSSAQTEEIARSIKDLEETKSIFFLPFFTGIGSPHWISEARASIMGLSRDTTSAHIVKACLEGIAFSINDLIEALKQDTGLNIESLKVDGGAVVNNYLMEIQATITNLEIIRPKVIETTAYGAALGAAIGLDIIKMQDIDNLWQEEKTFHPTKDLIEYYKTKQLCWGQLIQKIYL